MQAPCIHQTLVFRFDSVHTAVSSVNLRTFASFFHINQIFLRPSLKKCKLPQRKKQPPIPLWTAIQRLQDFQGKAAKFPSQIGRMTCPPTFVTFGMCGKFASSSANATNLLSHTIPERFPGVLFIWWFFACFFTQSETSDEGWRTMMVISFTSAFLMPRLFCCQCGTWWGVNDPLIAFSAFSSRGFFTGSVGLVGRFVV